MIILFTINDVDKSYKHKRSKYFTHEDGRLFYIGGEKSRCGDKKNHRLVVENVDARKRIISSIHDQAHLGRDKVLSQITPDIIGHRCTMMCVPM